MTTTPRLPVDHERLVQLIPERLDELIAGIDRRIGAQVDEILHHPLFQRIERAWRGLWFVVERTSFDENIRLELLNCSKDNLRDDFASAGATDKSGLHAIVYELAGAQARLRARLPEERRHLREQALAQAVDGPGRQLGARLAPGDLEA